MSSEIIHIVSMPSFYNGFQHLSFIFSPKNMFQYLKDYLMTKLTLG
jgi:hypothetical protein